jgi:hypothetical protein
MQLVIVFETVFKPEIKREFEAEVEFGTDVEIRVGIVVVITVGIGRNANIAGKRWLDFDRSVEVRDELRLTRRKPG